MELVYFCLNSQNREMQMTCHHDRHKLLKLLWSIILDLTVRMYILTASGDSKNRSRFSSTA
jgi:hypothetical protein